jgi:hypothetical protein
MMGAVPWLSFIDCITAAIQSLSFDRRVRRRGAVAQEVAEAMTAVRRDVQVERLLELLRKADESSGSRLPVLSLEPARRSALPATALTPTR